MTDSARVLVIAEAGVNHNGSIERALALVDVAAAAGADMVKFQSFRTDAIVGARAPKAAYQIANTGHAESQRDMLLRLELDENAHRLLIAHCRERGIEFVSTPFDAASLALLVELGVGRIKLGSGEVTNAPHLLAAARTGLPIIMSTGMSTLDEVQEALGVLAFGYGGGGEPGRAAFRAAWEDGAARGVLTDKVTLLHCTSAYPTPVADVNLRAMDTMREAFGLPVGFSDHTTGIAVAIGAVGRGATVIEKHFTLDRTLPGPDHKASLEPDELTVMVAGIRAVASALGDPRKQVAPSEADTRRIARRSIVAARPIARGTRLSPADLTFKRPGTGRSPFDYWDLIGTNAGRDYAPDDEIA